MSGSSLGVSESRKISSKLFLMCPAPTNSWSFLGYGWHIPANPGVFLGASSGLRHNAGAIHSADVAIQEQKAQRPQFEQQVWTGGLGKKLANSDMLCAGSMHICKRISFRYPTDLGIHG